MSTVSLIPQNIQDEILGKMVLMENGIEVIKLGSYCLDFKNTYAFLGFTKNKSKVILGDIYYYGKVNQDGKREIKYKKRFGTIQYESRTKPNYVKGVDGKFTNTGDIQYDEWRIVTDGHRYSEVIMEVEIKVDMSKVAVENTQALMNKDLLLEWD